MFPKIPFYLAIYNDNPYSIEMVARVLSGEAKAKGVLPVKWKFKK